MKNSVYARFSLSLLLILSLMAPFAVLAAGDGKKHFRDGMKHEIAEEWDQAVEEFSIAVTENPKNPEYKLHLQRALFNASQMYMKKGTTAAQQKDYESAYNAFRKAYAYDPVNELAKSEMARMIRMQEAMQKGEDPEKKADESGKVKLTPVSFNARPADVQIPQRLEKMRDVPFPGGVDLQYIVKELAKDLDLNVLFDAESRLENRKIRIELKNVTAAKALDYIFLQENLFFQKVGPRTILVATGNRRTNFQQLVLRTFYLANANPKDVKTIITSAIPAQPGRSQTIVIEDATTNSLTIRDTEENVRLFAKLISSLDKDRAEVVMDVAIYEVNKNDLLQFGNQIGTASGDRPSLGNLGGFGFPLVVAGQNSGPITGGLPFTGLNIASLALGIPYSQLTALQRKDNTKLIASTQIHAFNNEDSSARIGQRVPVRTAQFITGANQSNDGVVSNVINYEQVGLTLKFKPIVFPNQDVQVAMEIESKDVAGGSTDNPVFTERTIKGTARVQNNKTLLLASVAQNTESNGRQGLPLLGLIPIIGRLFTAPTRDNRQVDIVIAVTPRVIRAPAILPEDEVERPTGSLGTPTSGSLEAMIIQEEQEELLAAARRVPNVAQVQLPDRQVEKPAYVRTGADASSTPAVETNAVSSTAAPTTQPNAAVPQGLGMNLKPIDSGVKTLQINQTSDTSKAGPAELGNPAETPLDASTPRVELTLGAEMPVMKAGEKARIPVIVKSTGAFRSAVLGVRFDDKKLAVRAVTFGDVFGTGIANTMITPFLNQNGKMYVSLSTTDNQAVGLTQGVLAYIEVEALVDGKPDILLERDVLNFLAADGKNFAVKF
jgi:general secretion pathway protein D